MKIPAYLIAALAFLWLWSGLQPVLTAPDASLQLLADIGIATPWRRPLFYAASAWDVLLGILILTPLRRLARAVAAAKREYRRLHPHHRLLPARLLAAPLCAACQKPASTGAHRLFLPTNPE